MEYIPVSSVYMKNHELSNVTECITSGWLSSLGKYVFEFENRFSNYLGTKFSLTCSNGTSALHLGLLGLEIGEGDEVIVPSFTFIATINAILYCGASPVFVDIHPDTWCLDPENVKQKITDKTKAIMPVHLYGNPAHLDELLSMAQHNNLFIIEDCAEALGAEYQRKKIGSMGHVSCHSFYGNKIITCGEGGMVSTNSKEIADKITMLRDHGMSPKKPYFHETLAYNYRMTNLQAGVGLAQLENIDFFISERQLIFDEYKRHLKEIEEITLPFPGDSKRSPVNWLYTICLKRGNRDHLIDFLKKQNIDTRPVFHPCHKMPYINSKVSLPVTDMISASGISLPTFIGLTTDQIKYVSDQIKQFLISHTS